ncbi:amino acid--tRNA ligase-related protein, partial [Archangium sp.]|uniref:amino acid--tRNA ligase-related protein n=1 Tax=Archangium sp. TaxID=1872627 RepID=UPI002D70D392
ASRIFIMAPNIRLELASKKSSENHLLEFSQFDLEIKNGTMDDVMSFIEGLYVHLFGVLGTECAAELRALGRTLPRLVTPFPRYSNIGLRPEEVDSFADKLSRESRLPCFITSHKREFYDREDPDRPGTYRNFDLVHPEGYGEALSGAERTYEYDDIIRRMTELDMDLTPYANYLEVARRGLLPRTAGCGIGIQRLLKFICGKQAIADVCLFDRCVKTRFTF